MNSLLALFLVLIVNTAYAVDGYKEIKFGMSIAEVKAKKVCTISAKPEKSGNVESYLCSDFKFNGENTFGYFYFIDGKIQRVAFIAGGANELMAIIESLKEKYGAPTQTITKELGQAYDAGKIDRFDIAFDKDTIIARTMKVETKDMIMMIYTSPKFEELTKKHTMKKMTSDL